MIELTDQQQQALDTRQDQPLHLIDPRTSQTYVLLPTATYEQMKNLLDVEDEFDGMDVGKLIADAMGEDDENDPLLESYQKYRGSNDSAR